ncbi:MAG: DUF1295 domain-containing protein [Actinomycetota bacterium]
MSAGLLLLVNFGCLAVLLATLWLVSLRMRDASIVDIVWGPAFAVVGWVTFAVGEGDQDRRLLLALLATAWGLRLGLHLARRNLGKGEDPRYRAMRERRGEAFAIQSLYLVFLSQASLVWVVAMPIQAAGFPAATAELFWLDWLGVGVFLVGLGFEAVADVQLTRFRNDRATSGRVLDTGLWRYTRHPNYFGDCMLWWGIGIVGIAAGAWWALVGPVVMMILLSRVSGKPLLEQSIRQRRPGYDDYVRRTSGFFPLPPKR